MATLQDALTNVRCLEGLALPDEQPTIEPEPASVVYEVSFDTNFADRTAFITGIGKYNEEATICSNLVRGAFWRPKRGVVGEDSRGISREGVCRAKWNGELVKFMRHGILVSNLSPVAMKNNISIAFLLALCSVYCQIVNTHLECVCQRVITYAIYNAWNVQICLLTLQQNVILDEGESFAALLYTWRSMSRAVPAVS